MSQQTPSIIYSWIFQVIPYSNDILLYSFDLGHLDFYIYYLHSIHQVLNHARIFGTKSFFFFFEE